MGNRTDTGIALGALKFDALNVVKSAVGAIEGKVTILDRTGSEAEAKMVGQKFRWALIDRSSAHGLGGRANGILGGGFDSTANFRATLASAGASEAELAKFDAYVAKTAEAVIPEGETN